MIYFHLIQTGWDTCPSARGHSYHWKQCDIWQFLFGFWNKSHPICLHAIDSKHSWKPNLVLQIHFVFTVAKHSSAQMLAISFWSSMPPSSLQGVYRWGVGWMMRRRICHGPSRNCGDLPLWASNTKTEPHRSQLDRPSPPSPPPCPRRRATATTVSTRCPAAYKGSLAYLFMVRKGEPAGEQFISC